jgi:hypothetical protein
MVPIAQLNLREASYVPPVLKDLALITLFFAEPVLVDERQPGTWLLRSYRALDGLAEIDANPSAVHDAWSGAAQWKPRRVQYKVVERDYPCILDPRLSDELSDDVLDRWAEEATTSEQSKVGGWPYLLQSGMEWGTRHDEEIEFAFQLSGFNEGALPFRDIIYYVGRRQDSSISDWFLNSQSA